MSLAGNCLTVWLAWDSNQTILAAWSWKGQVEDWANRLGQKVDSIEQRQSWPGSSGQVPTLDMWVLCRLLW